MHVTAPTGRTYAVRRRWLPWRQRVPVDVVLFVTFLAGLELVVRVALTPVVATLRFLGLVPWELEVRDLGARREVVVVRRERVRGWAASTRRMAELASEVERQQVDPSPDFRVVVTRDPVAAGDDVDDNTRVYELDDRTSHPTLSSLVTAISDGGHWVTVAGPATTWVLRESDARRRRGRPLGILVLDRERRAIDVHPLGNLSYRVAKDGRFHLEYLLAQGVERTLEMIAEDPKGRRSLRVPRQA